VQSTSLAGRSILILEDEPLIALDIGDAFARAGAVVVPAKSLETAHDLVEVSSLSAAVVDFRLGDGEADALCAKLTARDIPFVIHSGLTHAARQSAVVIPKPASPTALIHAIAELLSRRRCGMPESAQTHQRATRLVRQAGARGKVSL
jgi:DNA-binding response OmpR family regulator